MPFVTYEDEMTEEDERFIEMIKSITMLCRAHIKKNMLELTKAFGRKKIDTDSIDILKHRNDKPPTLFVKVTTKYGKTPLVIDTDFKKIRNKRLVKMDPLSVLRKKCKIIGAFTIDNIYIASSIESIQTRLTEVLIVKEIKRASVFSDIDIEGNDSDEKDLSEEEW